MLRVFEHFGRRKVGMMDTSKRRTSTAWRSYGQETEASRKRNEDRRDANAEIAGEALAAVQTIVSALASPEGGRYSVVFDDSQPTGATQLVSRRIRVTPKPLFDPSLRMIEACTILTGLSTHEVGHTWISAETEGILNDYWPGSVTAQTVAFALDDTRVDAFLRRRFPGVAFAIRPTLAYIASQTGEQPPLRYTPQLSVANQLAFMINAVRYAKHCRWVGDPLTREMRTRWQAWATANAEITEKDEIIAAIKAGIAMIHEPVAPPQNQPSNEQAEPEEDEEIEEAEADDFGAGERDPEDDDESDSDGDDDWDEDEDDDEPGEGSDSDEGDEADDDDPSEGSDPSDDEPEDGDGSESDDPTDGEDNDEEPTDSGSNGGESWGATEDENDDDWDDESEDGDLDDDEPVDDDGSEAEADDEGWDQDADDEGDEPEDGSGEISGAPDVGDDEQGGGDSVDLSEVPEPGKDEDIPAPSIDDYNEDTSAEAMDLQERIEQQKTIERVSASDGFGTIKVQIVD